MDEKVMNNDKKVNEPKKVAEPKDELRSKFLSTFKIFDDEGPTIPVEVTNVGKLNFNIEDLDPNKKKKEPISTSEDDMGLDIDLDIEVEEKPVKNLIIDENYVKEIKTESNLQKHYKVLKFFGRFFTTILDQTAILAITYFYFLFMIKPSMMEIPYKYIEGMMYFIVNDKSSLTSLIIGYFLITFAYYTIFNILIRSTPFNYLLGYKIYRNDGIASIITLVFRNFVMIFLNLLLFFPYLFLIISDNKQTLYDKIFSTYLLKEN